MRLVLPSGCAPALLMGLGLCGCGDHALERFETPPPTPVAPVKPTGSLCAPMGSSFGAPVRVVFIVDMSISNVGVVREYTTNYTNTTYTLDSTDPAYPPSDLAGNRFGQIRDFVESCGGGDDVTYAVMGFGETSVLTNNNSCLSPFESQQSALWSIDGFKNMQLHDVALRTGKMVYPFYLQRHTYFHVALNCLKDKLTQDISLLGEEKPIYNVFFLSDGAPDDPVGQTNYTQMLEDIQLTVKDGASALNFYPVYYFDEGQATPDAAAQNVLNQMAHVVDPDVDALSLGDLSAEQSVFCQYLTPQASIHYELATLFAVNVNAMTVGDDLWPDSSASGLSDEAKKALDWPADSPRSSGVLDGLCQMYAATEAECQAEVARLGCDSTQAAALGLTDCDLKIASAIFGARLTGVDTDGDFVPDLIEILRGLSPVRADALDVPFADGLTNQDKIRRGLDVRSNAQLQPVDVDQQLILDFHPNETACQDGSLSYTYTLEQIPLVPTVAHVDPTSGFLPLGHAANENVLLLFSYWQSTGGVQLTRKLYTEKLIISPGSTDLETSGPLLLGEL